MGTFSCLFSSLLLVKFCKVGRWVIIVLLYVVLVFQKHRLDNEWEKTNLQITKKAGMKTPVFFLLKILSRKNLYIVKIL